MDALTLLTADHNRVRGLFSQFEKAAADDDTAAMVELAAEMRTEIEVHTTIEEEIFYPAIRDLDDEIRDDVAEGLEEHHEVKVLMDELKDLGPDDPAWKAKWTVVMENVEHHAGEEESDLFPPVRGKTDADRRRELGVELDRRKGELGAPTMADRSDLSAEEVRTLASDQEIPGRSKMDTDELRATVKP